VATMNGVTLNFVEVGRDVGVDDKTVKSHFQILEDTLIRFLPPAYHRSVSKTQLHSPQDFISLIAV
jgi:hypothetical protein